MDKKAGKKKKQTSGKLIKTEGEIRKYLLMNVDTLRSLPQGCAFSTSEDLTNYVIP
jgi:hypothetical protein